MKNRTKFKKTALLSIIFCMAVGCFGCKTNDTENVTEVLHDSENSADAATDANDDLAAYFDEITIDMLDACDTVFSGSDSYYNDPLILLNQYDEDVRLYGIHAGEESAMLLYVHGEKVLIRHSFWNRLLEPPKMHVYDWDDDGNDEIIISRITLTGTEVHREELLVCDYEDIWNVYVYDDYLQDIEDFIAYRYNETADTVDFSRKDDGQVLVDLKLPDWTEDYPYAGSVDFSGIVYFDAETLQMEVVPGIMLENYATPYYFPIAFLCDISYLNGAFEIKDCNIHIPDTDDVSETGETINADLADYEQRLEETVLVLEETLPDTEGIERQLPEYIHVLEHCVGDIGNDGIQDIAVVLEFDKEYPYETGDGVLAYGQRIVCIFTKREDDTYQYRYQNNRILLDADAADSLGLGIEIQDGFLILSNSLGSSTHCGETFRFGFGEVSGELELYEVRNYWYGNSTGEGEVEIYDFQNGAVEVYEIANWDKENLHDVIKKASFPVNGILFEDAERSTILELSYEIMNHYP